MPIDLDRSAANNKPAKGQKQSPAQPESKPVADAGEKFDAASYKENLLNEVLKVQGDLANAGQHNVVHNLTRLAERQKAEAERLGAVYQVLLDPDITDVMARKKALTAIANDKPLSSDFFDLPLAKPLLPASSEDSITFSRFFHASPAAGHSELLLSASTKQEETLTTES